jgi:hypothetical protein
MLNYESDIVKKQISRKIPNLNYLIKSRHLKLYCDTKFRRKQYALGGAGI